MKSLLEKAKNINDDDIEIYSDKKEQSKNANSEQKDSKSTVFFEYEEDFDELDSFIIEEYHEEHSIGLLAKSLILKSEAARTLPAKGLMAKSMEYISQLHNIDEMTEDEILDGFNEALLSSSTLEADSGEKSQPEINRDATDLEFNDISIENTINDTIDDTDNELSIVSFDEEVASPEAAAESEITVSVPEQVKDEAPREIVADIQIKTEQIKTKHDDTELESIPAEERDRILADIDSAVSDGRMEISEQTFEFEAEKKDWIFPVSAIALAAGLILGLAFYFTSLFSQIEVDIVEGRFTVDRAQSQLIERLRAQSEEALLEKEKEIAAINNSITQAESEQSEWARQYENRINELESDLRGKLNQELEAERSTLESMGFSGSEIDVRIQELSEEKEAFLAVELNNQLETMAKENDEKTQEFERQIEESKKALVEARDEAFVIERSIEEPVPEENVTVDTVEADENVNSVDTDSSIANDLQKLRKQQELEKLIINQLSTAYLGINTYIENESYTEALEAIRSLEAMLKEPDIAELAVVQNRKSYDTSMVAALRNYTLLKMTAKTNESIALSENNGSADSSVNSDNTESADVPAVDTDNGFAFTEEELAAAKELAAREAVEAAETEYKLKMQDLEAVYEELKNSYQEERQFAGTLVSRANEQIEQDINAALESYQKALDVIINEDGSSRVMIDKLLEAGIELEKQKGKVLVTQDELRELADIKNQQQEVKQIIENLENTDNTYTSQETTEQLLNLLEIKLLIREVLADASLDERYTNLYEKMDVYLDAYGSLKEQEGRESAEQEIKTRLSEIIE